MEACVAVRTQFTSTWPCILQVCLSYAYANALLEAGRNDEATASMFSLDSERKS